jgi:hypothetical protein
LSNYRGVDIFRNLRNILKIPEIHKKICEISEFAEVFPEISEIFRKFLAACEKFLSNIKLSVYFYCYKTVNNLGKLIVKW